MLWQFRYALARTRGAGERDHVHARMPDERLAGLRAGAGDEVEHALRQPGGLDRFGKHESVEWRDLGGLEHDGATGGKRGRDLERDLVQRIVPGVIAPTTPTGSRTTSELPTRCSKELLTSFA